MTLLGPHLDDLNFYLNKGWPEPILPRASKRNIASAELAEMYVFKNIKGYFPVFLLDEVLSELDEGKRNLLMKRLRGQISNLVDIS